ncbi:MAG TPA: M20/M25/M40 family metallo-hydrolase, partial [Gemmatimonadaceae bacterium]|nr:M20/M25/M40 family metallo-hydrolase [Gemmatimonadaceae bacterium]
MREYHRRLPSVCATVATAVWVALAPGKYIAAQDDGSLRRSVSDFTASHDSRIVRGLSNFLAIPNLASDRVDIRRNAEYLRDLLTTHGISARIIESTSGSPPAVYGELAASPSAAKTIVFYAHYDGQPVDSTKWTTPPWQPVLRDKPVEDGGAIIALPSVPGRMQGEWRLYGRSASDDKAPIIAMLAALDALSAAHIPRSVNLKFFFEGEEEAGSGHLREMLARNASLLSADAWLFGDGPIHQSRRQQI